MAIIHDVAALDLDKRLALRADGIMGTISGFADYDGHEVFDEIGASTASVRWADGERSVVWLADFGARVLH